MCHILYRWFYHHSDPHTLLKLYLTIIRPHLEYASPAWDPFHKTEIDAIENVQKFALKVCLKSWDSGYDSLLMNAQIPSQKTGSTQMNLCHLYKIINEVTHFPAAPVRPRAMHYNSRSVNSNSVSVPKLNTSSYQYSFFPKSLSLWNKLPEEVTNRTNVNTFKHHLSLIEFKVI